VVRRLRRDPESGAAAVEFAIVLPLLMLIVLGCIDWGYYFFCDQIVTNAAREGARAGAVADPALNPNRRAIAEAAARNYLTASGITGGTGRPTLTITATDDSSGGALGVRVDISYAVGSVSGFLPTPSSGRGPALIPDAATARALMRYELTSP
jgi:Flp pilus assembly protein TadG